MATKTKCAWCCRDMVDETDGKDVPLCSEQCEDEWAKPVPEPRRVRYADERNDDIPYEPGDPDYGGVLGADGQIYSDADPGL